MPILAQTVPPGLLDWAETQGIGAVFALLLLFVMYRTLLRISDSIDRLNASVSELNRSIAVMLDRATRVAEKTIDVAQLTGERIERHTAQHKE